ncbi:hypothetical protein LVD15_23250 [Fulvivirga maritima]|uniref:hypothetical protein n=1 Tax=Fulvivirga maritima TaxID=2904247 RepID=UPI001F407E3F|nr:hypothetical protein [Fulvivirga maritima]UII26187.1 hypothetical protein LVD15_23250 [Fulvivirga maritima]
MVGSTIIKVDDASAVSDMTFDDMMEAAILPKVELDVLLTLDFEIMASDVEERWSGGQPLLFDADGGFVILPIKEAGLKAVISQKEEETELEKRDDLEKLAEFVKNHGFKNLYEAATF